MTEQNKVSAAAIMDRLDKIAASTQVLTPAPLLIYKPNPVVAKGSALKIQARAIPGETRYEYNGGCFMEIVAQIPSDGEFARFGWKDEPLTVKLGLPDLTAMLLCYRNVRNLGQAVPDKLKAMTKNASGKFVPVDTDTLGLVHKTGTATTVIKWHFDPVRGSIIEISRGREVKRTISLTLTEEVAFARYLELAMDVLLLTGV